MPPVREFSDNEPELKTACMHITVLFLFFNTLSFLLAFFLECKQDSQGNCRPLGLPVDSSTGAYDMKELRHFCVALCVYYIVAYILMMRQGLNKNVVNADIVKKLDKMPQYMQEAITNYNRSFENMLEQMPMFVPVLIVYALFVNPLGAGIIGGVYTVFLILYPFTFGSALVALSTMPRYILVHYMIWAILVTSIWSYTYPAQTTGVVTL